MKDGLIACLSEADVSFVWSALHRQPTLNRETCHACLTSCDATETDREVWARVCEVSQKCSAWNTKVVSPAWLSRAQVLLRRRCTGSGPHRNTPTQALPTSPCARPHRSA